MSDRASVDDSLTELRGSLAGDVLTPADAGYDAARRCFNALVDRRPSCAATRTSRRARTSSFREAARRGRS